MDIKIKEKDNNRFKGLKYGSFLGFLYDGQIRLHMLYQDQLGRYKILNLCTGVSHLPTFADLNSVIEYLDGETNFIKVYSENEYKITISIEEK